MFARSLAARSFHFPSPCPVNNMLGAPKLARQTPLAIRPVVALIAPSTLISHSSMRSPTFLGGDVSFLAPTPSVAAFHSGVGAFEKAIVWDERVAAVNELLKQKTSFDFHERLQTEAEERPIICYDQLLDIAVSTGMTREEGAEVICAMQTAGVLVRFQNAVYLKPSELVDTVMEHLPLPSAEQSKLVAEYEDKLTTIKEELEPLEREMNRVHRAANSRARTYLWLGLIMLCVQLGAFIRLTFWELSWDVMEPIGFFVQLATGILAYAWFMLYGSEMTYGNIHQSYYGATKNRKLKGMDAMQEKHRILLRQAQHYEKFLRWAKK